MIPPLKTRARVRVRGRVPPRVLVVDYGMGNLRSVAKALDKHRVSIANVAVRAILDRPAVAGVIVGTRLGVAEHIADSARVFDLELDGDDLSKIHAVSAKSHDLMKLIGDCGDEYR